MTLIPRTNPYDLTKTEIDFLRGSTVSDDVKEYLSRQHENIGTKTSAYRKVAAAARAECEALIAIRDLAQVHGDLASLEAASAIIREADRKAAALEATVNRKDGEIMRLTAARALVVHSE